MHTPTSLARELPRYRADQIWRGLFSPHVQSYEDITTLPEELRKELAGSVPFITIRRSRVFISAQKDTFKAWLELSDGHAIEAVLMKNSRGGYTLCVSSQVGCAMKCSFCATGAMGFTRNLTTREIIDQYRFFRSYLSRHPQYAGRISNIVYMGMGEPLANYGAVRESLQLLLMYTDIGPTRITVSTVGHLAALNSVLTDPAWPPVRLAISLHSALPKTRRALMPTSFEGFFDRLADWAGRYARLHPEVRRHLTFEYVLLPGINDTLTHARALVRFVGRVGAVRINLIPYNQTGMKIGKSGAASHFFQSYLKKHGLTVTERRSRGSDIAAACGQLVTRGTPAV